MYNLCVVQESAGDVQKRSRYTLVATILASAMTFIDGTVVNVAMPALQRDLGATITDVQWVIEAYALFLGALILVGGSLGDQLGRRRVFLAGVIWFTAASVLCGFAPTSLVLVIGRALQGIGAAFLIPGSLAIISATFSGAERGRAIGTWSGFSAITTAIGPVAGGWLVDHVSWRAVFFLNVPLSAIVVVLSFAYVADSRDTTRSSSTDWTGATLAIAALAGIVLGLLEWPPLGATHPVVIASLICGVMAFVAMILVERRKKDAMVPLDLFSSRAFSLANLLTLFLYAALAEMLFLVPLDLIQVRGYDATTVGAVLLPFPLIIFLLSRWSGGLVARVGSRVPLTAGPIVAAIGLALFALSPHDGSLMRSTLPAVAVLGLGMAITVAPLTTTVMDAADVAHSGAASGVNNAVARIAGLIAIAGFGIFVAHSFETRVLPRIHELGLPAEANAAVVRELPKMAGIDVGSLQSVPANAHDALRNALDTSFASAFRLAMFGTAALAVIAALIGANIGELRGQPRGATAERRGQPNRADSRNALTAELRELRTAHVRFSALFVVRVSRLSAQFGCPRCSAVCAVRLLCRAEARILPFWCVCSCLVHSACTR
jgi:EmrB/QacA subfamily drug resistance transporter